LPIKTISSAKRRQFIISEAKLTPKFCSDNILTKSFNDGILEMIK
jgi:hypothetical protein